MCIGLDDGLASNKRQAIIGTNADPIHWHYTARGTDCCGIIQQQNHEFWWWCCGMEKLSALKTHCEITGDQWIPYEKASNAEHSLQKRWIMRPGGLMFSVLLVGQNEMKCCVLGHLLIWCGWTGQCIMTRASALVWRNCWKNNRYAADLSPNVA